MRQPTKVEMKRLEDNLRRVAELGRRGSITPAQQDAMYNQIIKGEQILRDEETAVMELQRSM